MAPASVESDLSSQSSLSGPSSDAEMETNDVSARARPRRVINDDEEDGSPEAAPSRSSRAVARVRYDENDGEDDEDEDQEEDESVDNDEQDAEGEEDEEDDQLLDDEENDEDAEGSDVDELEEDEEEKTATAAGNSRSGRKITLRIPSNKKTATASHGRAGSSRGEARAARNSTSRNKKARARTDAGEILDDEEESFEEFENEDIFASLPKTARQLAKEKAEQGIESPGSELLELPPEESKKARMTESEMALKRSELARRRRNQTEKKLEDDKIETINRLLKKQVSRTGGRSKKDKNGSDADEDGDGGDEAGQHGSELRPTPQELKDMPAPYFRYISSIRDGVLVRSTLSLPLETTDAGEESLEQDDKAISAPYKRKWDEIFGNKAAAQRAVPAAGQ